MTDGLSATEIGRKFGITRNAALGKLNRLGLLGQRRVVTVKAPRVETSRPAPAPKPERARKAVQLKEPDLDPACLVTILDAKKTQCHWPVGDPCSPEFRFCGKEAKDGPYCPEHKKYLQDSRQHRAPRKKRQASAHMWNIK